MALKKKGLSLSTSTIVETDLVRRGGVKRRQRFLRAVAANTGADQVIGVDRVDRDRSNGTIDSHCEAARDQVSPRSVDLNSTRTASESQSRYLAASEVQVRCEESVVSKMIEPDELVGCWLIDVHCGVRTVRP